MHVHGRLGQQNVTHPKEGYVDAELCFIIPYNQNIQKIINN